MIAAAIALTAACGPPTSGGGALPPELPSPTPDAVVRVSTGGGNTSVRPMSADGRWVAYSIPMLESPASVSDAALWDASDGSTVAVTDGADNGAPAGSVTDPPFVSNDGSTVVFTTTVPVVAGLVNTGNSVFMYSTATGVTEQLEVPMSIDELSDLRRSGEALREVARSLGL